MGAGKGIVELVRLEPIGFDENGNCQPKSKEQLQADLRVGRLVCHSVACS